MADSNPAGSSVSKATYLGSTLPAFSYAGNLTGEAKQAPPSAVYVGGIVDPDYTPESITPVAAPGEGYKLPGYAIVGKTGPRGKGFKDFPSYLKAINHTLGQTSAAVPPKPTVRPADPVVTQPNTGGTAQPAPATNTGGPQPPAANTGGPQPPAANTGPAQPPATPAREDIHFYKPSSWKGGTRVGLVGDSHSDAHTIYGPKHMWWMRALPEAGALLQSGRHGVEAWAGFSVNQLIYGGTASGVGADAALQRALAKKPEVLIAMSGGNDAVQTNETPEVYARRLDELHKRVTAAKAELLYIFPPPLFATAPQSTEIKEKFKVLRTVAQDKAKALGFGYMDIWDEYPNGVPASWNFGDNTHFTLEGHDVLAQKMLPRLKEFIKPAQLGENAWAMGSRQVISDVYNTATATRMNRPSQLGEGPSQYAYRLDVPQLAESHGYTSVAEHLDNITTGTVLDFACSFTVMSNTATDGSGLELALIDTTTWSAIETFGKIRTTRWVGRGGMSWTADKDYAGVRPAALIRDSAGPIRALVSDYHCTVTRPGA